MLHRGGYEEGPTRCAGVSRVQGWDESCEGAAACCAEEGDGWLGGGCHCIRWWDGGLLCAADLLEGREDWVYIAGWKGYMFADIWLYIVVVVGLLVKAAI